MLRLTIYKLFFLSGLLLSPLLNAEGEYRDPIDHFFDQSLGDLQEELEIAKEEGKQGLLLFFEQEECPFCARMKSDVLNRVHVQDYYREHFRIIPIDIEGDIVIQDFAGNDISQKEFSEKVHRVRATPVLLFVDLEGNPVTRYTGATSGIDEFNWLAEYVITAQYKDQPFARYKRQKRKANNQ